MFENLLDEVLLFFKTGVSPIPVSETLEIAAILGAAGISMNKSCEWIAVNG